MYKALGRQLRRPSGFFGGLVSKMMEVRNKTAYDKILKDLDIKKGDKIFEIGYGPGWGINLIAKAGLATIISGIDYSDLMFFKAGTKNKKFIDIGMVKLQHGDLLTANTGTEKFNKIFCLNVIYFWPDLHQAFTRVNAMLEKGGLYCIYMDHEKDYKNLKFTADFCKYSIEEVVTALKNADFEFIGYKLDKGYYIKALK